MVRSKMMIIGVTGGVGCGKSQVMEYLSGHFDGPALLTDDLARELMQKGGACYEPVLSIFGEDCLLPNGEFDRPWIGRQVFANPGLLEKLNQATHPVVKQAVIDRIEEAREVGREFFFLESALLLEEKYDEMCQEVWYVYAEETVRRERLKRSRGYSDEKITSIMKNQLPEASFREKSTFVLDNSGSFEETAKSIEARIVRVSQGERNKGKLE